MPIPTNVKDLSKIADENSPAGTERVFPDLDNHLRTIYSFLAGFTYGEGFRTDVIPATALAASGVSAGSYSRVTVDHKGRVTAGGAITSSDVANAFNVSSGGSYPISITGSAAIASRQTGSQVGGIGNAFIIENKAEGTGTAAQLEAKIGAMGVSRGALRWSYTSGVSTATDCALYVSRGNSGSGWESADERILHTKWLYSGDRETMVRLNSSFGTYPSHDARAWVNFDGRGAANANMTIRGSGGVAHVTRHGTGDYTVEFSKAYPDANYAITGTASMAGVGGAAMLTVIENVNSTGAYIDKSAQRCRILTVDKNGNPQDAASCNFLMFR